MTTQPDPYVTLGIAPDADDEAIRRRYLQLVRENPPEREPAKFTEIRAAYDQVCDPERAWSRRLFDVSEGESLEDILQGLDGLISGQRFPTDLLLSLGDK